mgnify:FL=1
MSGKLGQRKNLSKGNKIHFKILTLGEKLKFTFFFRSKFDFVDFNLSVFHIKIIKTKQILQNHFKMKYIFSVVMGLFLGNAIIPVQSEPSSFKTPLGGIVNGDSEQLSSTTPRYDSSFKKIRTQEEEEEVETPTITVPVWPQKKCNAQVQKFMTSAVKCAWSSCASCCEFKQLYDQNTYFVGEEMCIGFNRQRCNEMNTNAVQCVSSSLTIQGIRTCFATWYDATYPKEYRMILATPDTGAVIAWSTTSNSWGATLSNDEDKRIHLLIHSTKQ